MAKAAIQERNVMRVVVLWWESDINRLRVIRLIAYGLFAASIAGTIYSAYKGVLPLWAITVYVAFAVQLTFMTFMYAIKHSSTEEIRRAIFGLRHYNVEQWRFEREMLAEFTRYAFCLSASIDPAPKAGFGQRRGRPSKGIWPQIDTSATVCAQVRKSVQSKLGDPDVVVEIDFIAYSAETLIELSRDISAEIEDVIQDSAQQGGPRFEGRVKVRILIRDSSEGAEWLVPLADDREKDVEYATDLRTRFKNVQRSALKEFQESLKDILTSRQVDFRVRAYQTEPLLKGVLVDGQRGLFGIYAISDLRDPEGVDYSGHAVSLCLCDMDGDFPTRAAAVFMAHWFNHLWESDRLSRSQDP